MKTIVKHSLAGLLAFTGALGACMPTGGGLGKPPENAVCAWIQFPGERIYVCAAPDQLKALEVQAATARSHGAT